MVDNNEEKYQKNLKRQNLKIVLDGLVVGVVTGFIGAGGGFMIIPALVLFVGLPMKIAVGTSMFIITLKSLIGFIGDIHAFPDIDFGFLILFTVFSFIGIPLGNKVSNFTSEKILKNGFGVLLTIVALYIVIIEFIIIGG